MKCQRFFLSPLASIDLNLQISLMSIFCSLGKPNFLFARDSTSSLNPSCKVPVTSIYSPIYIIEIK